jgi:putative ABC transport system permease protein
MFKNHFKIAFRNFQRNKVFSLINMSGLAIGISASLVIYLIVQHEFNYDKFHKDGDRVYRIVSNIQFPDLLIKNSGAAAPAGRAVRNDVTGVENAALFKTVTAKVSIPGADANAPAVFRDQKNVIFCDGEYYRVFDYKWLAGSAATALKDPNKVVLTESKALAYFGNTSLSDVIGKEVVYDDSIKTTVSGVVADLRENTDFVFKDFISMATIESNQSLKDQMNWDSWTSLNSNVQLMVKLEKGTSTERVRSQLMALQNKNVNKEESKFAVDYLLQPITDIHFNQDYEAFEQRQAHLPTLYGLLAVSAFLLLLGCINFINLTTAQAAQRAREIGIRKTMGSGKVQLMVQFLSETMLLTFLATLLSVIIAPWLLSIFKDFIPEGISFKSLNQPHVWGFLVAIIVIVGLLAGFYPALVLTRFKPVGVLKNQVSANSSQSRKAWLRKTLTVTQFVIAQFLIIATLVVGKQIHFSLNKDLGYRKDAIVTISTPWNFYSKVEDNRRFLLQQKVNAIPEVQMTSISSSAPASSSTSSNMVKFRKDTSMHETMVEIKLADPGYFKIYDMKFLAGAPLSQSDTIKEAVINETYAKMLGYKNPSDILGKSLFLNDKDVPVTGVVADFHTKSTRAAIKPLAFVSNKSYSYTLHLAMRGDNPANWKNAINKIRDEYRQLYPDNEFSFQFYDESIAKFYEAEQKISRLLSWATGLCVFISCLGLLGLAIYVTNTRTKEIGMRKILGATVFQIVSLLSKDFLILVMIASLIAIPLGWWATNNWLQDFAYRTSLNWWLFAIAGIGMTLVALMILSVRTVKSALESPVKSLRSE